MSKPRYRIVVCMDDASRLCGYSEQTFIGTSTALEGGVLMIFQDAGMYTNINWTRLRWYSCEPIESETEPTQ